ncbi:hypothetical protein Sviol_43680 [Streptomyces violascens]|uniref:Uncharacterized protein n=2 Tax=Streptomyces violascens TaxID=67381 RepID=A0ABQ3QRU3_9ACTN|nr:hypothetical protein Sviol_43680 [Streptomyces violascens]
MFHVLTHQGGADFLLHPDIPALTLDRGSLRLGNTPVHTAHFGGDRITWVQEAPGRFTSGHLYVCEGGLSVRGALFIGRSPADAEQRAIYGTVVKPAIYNTRITTTTHPVGTDLHDIPEAEWTEGLPLEISYTVGMDESLPKPQVSLAGEDITDETTWKIDDKGRTVLQLVLSSDTCDFTSEESDFYKRATLAFDMYQPQPQGEGAVAELCSQSSAADGQVRLWQAIPQAGQVVATPPSTELSATEVSAVASELNVAELMQILPDDSVDERSKSLLIRNMKWAMGQDGTEKKWLETFFAQEPPVIDDQQQDLIKKSLPWYQNELTKAYLTQCFNQYKGPNEPTVRLSDEQAKKLTGYFKSGLAQSKDFTAQQQGIFTTAFIEAKPRLQDYISDGGKKWAKNLFDTLTEPQHFVLMVNCIYGAEGDPAALAPLKNFATLLATLEPDAEIAKDYYSRVLQGVLERGVPEGKLDDSDIFSDWIRPALAELLRQAADGEIPLPDGLLKNDALALYEALLKGSAGISAALGALGLAVKDLVLRKQFAELEQRFNEGALPEEYTRWAEANPKLAGFLSKAVKFFLIAGWSVGTALLITSLVRGDWKKMSDQERAQVVLSAVRLTIAGIKVVPEIVNGAISLTLKIWNGFKQAFFAKDLQMLMGDVVASALPAEVELTDFAKIAAENIDDILSAGGEVIGESSAFARLFTKANLAKFLKGLSVAAAVAAVGLSMWKLIKDIQDHGSVTDIVFDSLNLAITCLLAAVAVAEIFITSAILSVAGPVLALAGLILAIVQLFVAKPKNPLDEFMENVGVPFADGLPKPKPTPALAVAR